jgi:tetratricopeptide (TPR) repeat protein
VARGGDVDSAVALFQTALGLNPDLPLDSKGEAARLAALSLVEEGEELLTQRQVEKALAAYAKARQLDPTLELSAESWNTLCRFGSLWGQATEAMHACEQAIMLAPEHGGFRDSRGLARALTGDVDGAMADFQAFIAWTKDVEQRSKRQGWIEDLGAGKNPFIPEEIDELRRQ